MYVDGVVVIYHREWLHYVTALLMRIFHPCLNA